MAVRLAANRKNKRAQLEMHIVHGLILILILASVFGLIVVKEAFFGGSDTLEAFGATQPGVFVQLASTHVPTAEDEEEARRYPYQVNREIANMTGEPLF